ncbi:MAG: hypothetical protein HN778_12045 [Prolixibacteraceae bacterium]|jgi:hypothetical protein|nr:hypothetical protein [Prolixibacteraceae bacterium]MBT6006989.1 hypothetical protein [Prolixibacteraceae bacterium]MBT6766435.1 hypothetical protein [Prolixibacteraceae bacterium]MBT7000624.1 hypothetical protein [Prolixibacteraceae bacterium]MBT7395557.1 hypothetical protein [Prolixibacteraceae bacterium]
MESRSNRRDFLKIIGTGASYIAITSTLWGINACNQKITDEDLFHLFSNPPAEAKPFYRWWWNGNLLTKKEVIRELKIMKSAGAGGVEINPIALNPAVKNPIGKELEWLSNEWIEILNTAINKGKELGMISDLIIGTGWPFGGKFLDDSETIQGHDIYTEKINGPTIYSFNNKNLNEGAVITHAQLIPVPIKNFNEVKAITNEIQNGTVSIPSGEFEISVISWRNKFRDVMHGAPGGDGPVLDHFNKKAVEKYLNRTSDGLKPFLGDNLGSSIRSMFCDSIELSGANWTSDFREEFKNRNAYDIWEFLPLILNNNLNAEGDFSDTLLRARYDYYSTLSELFMDRFIKPFHMWCQKVGVKSRYQAYGHPWVPTDLLDGNMIPDIPEGDQWLFNGGWTETQLDQIRYAIWDKYTSSAVHLRGLKIASCEAMTNTSGVFSASLEYIKQATDINVVAGINHLVLHGWNYSPPEAGFPGWMRYGTYFSEKNPWFPYLKLWSDYAARLSAVFQNSQAVSQVAIIGPTADRWSESGLDRNPFLKEPWYLHSLWQSMNHNGYCSDYLNPRIFSEADYENGQINYGPMSYQTVIICGMESIFPEFIDSLSEYANSGGKIIFIDKIPSKSPGMKFKGNFIVKEKMAVLFSQFSKNVIVVDAPQKGNLEKLTEWTKELLSKQNIKPGVKISIPDERLYLYQAENEGKPVFFFSNQNRSKSISFDAEFENEKLYPWRWNAETGKKSLFSINKKNISIHLEPLESLLLVFSVQQGEILKIKKSIPSKEINLNEKWHAEFFPVEGESFKKEIPVLGDLSKITGTNTFGGTIVYQKTVELNSQTTLSLGKVAETAEVTLNGKNLGVKWWGEKTFDISGTKNVGTNNLEIKVTTLLWNYCNSFTMEENPMAKLWANNNKIKDNKPLSTGLIGPVIIS